MPKRNKKETRGSKSSGLKIDGWRKTAILVFVVLIICALFFLAYYFGIFAKSCDSSACFIDAASSCRSAKFTQDEGGNILSYRTRGCILIKSAGTLNESESPEMAELFKGKSMECKITNGAFDAQLVNTLSFGLENCEGDLKTSILEISMVVY